MLILSIVMAAMAPVMTTRNKLDQSSPWQWSTNGSDAYYGIGDAQVAMIGQQVAQNDDTGARLVINAGDGKDHILFKTDENIEGRLRFENNGLLLGSLVSGNLVSNAVAIGRNTQVSQSNSTAVGVSTSATNINATALGANASAVSSDATAIGSNAAASGLNSTALGVDTVASQTGAIAIGQGSKSSGVRSITIGSGNKLSGTDSIVIGSSNNSNTLSSSNSISIGTSALASVDNSVAIGYNSKASANYSTVLGYDSKASGQSSSALGYGAEASGQSSSALGFGTKASGHSSTALGFGSVASGASSTALGYNPEASGNYSIASGYYSKAYGANSTSMGSSSEASGTSSIALGYNALAKGANNVALGYNACRYVTGSDVTCLGANSGPLSGSSLAGTSNMVYIGNSSSTVYIPGKLYVGSDLIVDGNAVLAADTNSLAYLRTNAAKGGGSKTGLWRLGNYGGYIKEINNVDYSGYDFLKGFPGVFSDRRLKYVGKENTLGLDKIKQLKVFNYTFKKDKKKTPHVGVIAQDLQKVFPDAVSKAKDGFLRIRFEDMFFAMINAIKELDSRITALEKENKQLKEQNKALDARLRVLESKIK